MKKFTKPKIVISSYDDIKNPYYGGGGAVAVHEVAKRLTDKYEVTAVTGRYPNSKSEKIDRVRYKRVGISSGFAKLDQLLFHLFLHKQVVRENFDVWIESFTPPFSTSFLPLFTKKPVVGLVHMLAAADMERKYKAPFHLVENLGLRFYKNFIVSSEEFKKKVIKQNPSAKVSIIPNGINLPKVKNRNKKHILFIGRVEVNQKGLDLLLAAYKLITDKLDYPLVIAGAGEAREEKKLERIIREFGLEKKVKVLGKLEKGEKKKAFEEAILAVIPSRFETFSLVALEALSYRVPVVCFDIDGLRWLPKDVCLKVKPFDSQNLAESLLFLLKNTRERLKIAARGGEFAERFSWNSTCQDYKNVIQKLIKTEMTTGEVFKNIIDKKIECFFISPHFDDAVFSAGGLLSYLAKKTRVVVVNVFTKVGEKPYTLSAKRFLAQCGCLNATKLYSDRLKEDNQVFKKTKIKVINLGFKEALWRKKKDKLPSLFERVLPELSYTYPTYRFNVIKGVISKEDEALIKKLENKLTKLVKRRDSYLVFCPAAQGNHVDHVIVRNVCDKLFKNKIFWSDYPYNLRGGLDNSFINRSAFGKLVFEENLSQKEKLVKGYKSQLKAMFPKGKIILVPEEYFLGLDFLV